MYLLFINELRSFALSLTLRAIYFVEDETNIIQIVQSHFARAGQRNIIRVEHMSLSVTALQWRLACTTSSVFIQRRLTNIH